MRATQEKISLFLIFVGIALGSVWPLQLACMRCLDVFAGGRVAGRVLASWCALSWFLILVLCFFVELAYVSRNLHGSIEVPASFLMYGLY